MTGSALLIFDQHERADRHERDQLGDVGVLERDAAPRPIDLAPVERELVGAVDADRVADAGVRESRNKVN